MNTLAGIRRCATYRIITAQRPALADLSLTIERGEIFAFLGPNGGGKTTLFRLLSTLIPLAAGARCDILGFDLRTPGARGPRVRSASSFKPPASTRS